jgi:hypothetical protein
MKKAAALLILFAACLLAANFWQKPYTEWSDKDVTKMMTDSPWVKSSSVAMTFPGGNAAPPAGGGGGGGRGGGPQGQFEGGGGVPSIEILARFESALPIRQALVRQKFGAEADKSEEATKVLSVEPKSYEIVLSGPMGMFVMGPPDQVSSRLTEVTSLSSAKSAPIKPSLIQVGKPGRKMDVLFVFPRAMPFTVDDQEVTFATKLGTSSVKYKFKLKDMVVNGKLEM